LFYTTQHHPEAAQNLPALWIYAAAVKEKEDHVKDYCLNNPLKHGLRKEPNE